MKNILITLLSMLIPSSVIMAQYQNVQEKASLVNVPLEKFVSQQKTLFNFDWKFSKPAGFVPQDTLFLSPDIKWEDVCLPHDWSISEGYTKTQTAGSNGFLSGGVGIYMKNFLTSDDMNGKKVFIHFEGVYNNSKVWINGHMLGFRPNGYVGFEYELTQYLKPKGSMNTITVCVDRRAYADSRWYVGAGIYRNVSLILRNELYIPSDGIFVTTPQVGNRSMVNVVCEVKNAGTGVKGVTVKHEVVYDGKTIASVSDDFVVQQVGVYYSGHGGGIPVAEACLLELPSFVQFFPERDGY